MDRMGSDKIDESVLRGLGHIKRTENDWITKNVMWDSMWVVV